MRNPSIRPVQHLTALRNAFAAVLAVLPVMVAMGINAPVASAATLTTHATPALFSLCGTSGCGPGVLYTGDNSVSNCGLAPCHNLYFSEVPSGLGNYPINEFAQGGTGPGACVVLGQAYMVWAGSDASGHVYGAQFNFSPNTVGRVMLSGTTRHTPSCTVGPDGFLYIAWVGTDSHIHVVQSMDYGATFSPTYTIASPTGSIEASSFGVSITSTMIGSVSTIVIAWAGTDNPHHINWGIFAPNCANYTTACKLTFKYTDTSNTTLTDVTVAPQNTCHSTFGPAVTWKGTNNGDFNVKSYWQANGNTGSTSCYQHTTPGSQTGFGYIFIDNQGQYPESHYYAYGAVNGGQLQVGLV